MNDSRIVGGKRRAALGRIVEAAPYTSIVGGLSALASGLIWRMGNDPAAAFFALLTIAASLIALTAAVATTSSSGKSVYSTITFALFLCGAVFLGMATSGQ